MSEDLKYKLVTKEHYSVDQEGQNSFNQTFALNFNDLKSYLKSKEVNGRAFVERRFDGIARFQHSNGSFYHYNLKTKVWGQGDAY